jgi:2-oxoglutarate dehydrogenase E1 component
MIETPTAPAPATTDREILDAFRRWGDLQADLDPLGRELPYSLPALDLDGPAADQGRRHYCGTLAVEYMHIPDPGKRAWIERRMEADPPAIDPSRSSRRCSTPAASIAPNRRSWR